MWIIGYSGALNNGHACSQVMRLYSNGSLAWIMNYGATWDIYSRALATNDNLNIAYVGGWAGAALDGQPLTGGSGANAFVSAILPNNSRQWTRMYGLGSGTSENFAITVNPTSGMIYAVGAANTVNLGHMALYATNSTRIWIT